MCSSLQRPRPNWRIQSQRTVILKHKLKTLRKYSKVDSNRPQTKTACLDLSFECCFKQYSSNCITKSDNWCDKEGERCTLGGAETLKCVLGWSWDGHQHPPVTFSRNTLLNWWVGAADRDIHYKDAVPVLTCFDMSRPASSSHQTGNGGLCVSSYAPVQEEACVLVRRYFSVHSCQTEPANQWAN